MRPICFLDKEGGGSAKFKEAELIELVEKYTERLGDNLRKSFSKPKALVTEAMQNYDPHFLFIMSSNNSLPAEDRVKGMLVFSLDTSLKKDPVVDVEKCSVSFNRITKVNLHHITALDESQFDVLLDLALDFIWKTMHCSVIRVKLHHFEQYDAKTERNKLMCYDLLKQQFKKRVFRWQQLINDSINNLRIEVLEGKNCVFKEQLKPETAFIYRRNLNKQDICKDTLNLTVKNKILLGDQSSEITADKKDTREVTCASLLIGDLVDFKRLNL